MSDERIAKQKRLIMSLAAASVLTFVTSLAIGAGTFGFPNGPARWLILLEVRVPRACFGLLVGAGLGIAGAALQGYLRNPLAEPGLLGVSGGAALGSVLAIHAGLAGAFALALPLAGLCGAALATAVLFAIAGEKSGPVALMLAGVALASLTAAGISLALNLSSNPFAAAEAIFWLMGSLADRSTTQVYLAAPLIVLGIIMLMRAGRALDALTLGEDVATTVGIDIAALRRNVIIGTALVVGASTAVTGMIGFVGLIVPHILRPWTEHRPSSLLLASALGGAVLLLAADVMIRLLAPWVELRIGVLTALLGAPFFLWLVARSRVELSP
jgi:iron complex transport system permease protein